MVYAQTPSSLGKPSDIALIQGTETFPTTFRYGLMSLWFEVETSADVGYNLDIPFAGGGFTFDRPGLDVLLSIGMGTTQSLLISSLPIGAEFVNVDGSWTFPAVSLGVMHNIILSFDALTSTFQAALDGELLTPTWIVLNDPQVITSGSFAGIKATYTDQTICFADFFLDTPSAFFDLTVSGNIQKFIAGGQPVDLGLDASSVTGQVPKVYLSVRPGGVADDILTNRGSGGGNFGPFAPPLCAVIPPPPTVTPPKPTKSLGIYRGIVGINFYGKTLFGDAFAGVVGQASFDTFTEYGNIMTGEIASPPIHKNRKRVFVPKFELDVESGVGLTAGQGSDPVWMLQWSKDGGRTWSNLQPWRSMGRIGMFQQRLRWQRLGQARQWVFRLRSTDPVRRVLIGVYLEAYEGMD